MIPSSSGKRPRGRPRKDAPPWIPPPPPPVPSFSEGHRLMLLQEGTLEQIGAKVGASKQVVSLWRNGSVPSPGARYRLQAALGIPVGAWVQEPNGPKISTRHGSVPPGSVVSGALRPITNTSAAGGAEPFPKPAELPADGKALEPAEAPPGPPAAPEAPPKPGEAPTTIEGVESLLAMIRRAQTQENLLASEQVRLADAETRLLGLRHRIEKETELSEDRIVRLHPKWIRVRALLAETLIQWPDAARAVAAALRELDL